MSAFFRGLAVVTALSGAALGLAGSASADAPNGTYTGTVIDGSVFVQAGVTKAVSLSPCGPDCVHFQLVDAPAAADLLRQSDSWTGTQVDGDHTWTYALDNSLVLSTTLDGSPAVRWQLTNNA